MGFGNGEKIGFWKTTSKNGNVYNISHKNGLDLDQVKFLRSLKTGDKLILFENRSTSSSHPTYILQKSVLSQTLGTSTGMSSLGDSVEGDDVQTVDGTSNVSAEDDGFQTVE